MASESAEPGRPHDEAEDLTTPPTPAEPFQVMPPPLTVEEYDALVSDIRPLGVDCPVEVRHVGSHEEARQLALTLNVARRQITQEQRARLIVQELLLGGIASLGGGPS